MRQCRPSPLRTAPIVSRVSVIMAVYNGATYLRQAIDSVLRQTVSAFEFVIVDDGSTDETPGILRGIRDARVRVLRNDRNLGHATSLNRAIRAAAHPLLARHDADDVALADRLERQLAAFDAQPGLALVGGQATAIDAHGRPLIRSMVPYPTSDAGLRWRLLYGSAFVHPSVMFTRQSFEEVGGYNERFRRAEDFDLWSRMIRRYPVRNLPDALLQFRHVRSAAKIDAHSLDTPPVRDVIAQNARHFLAADTADHGLAQLIELWPDYAVALRSPYPAPPARSPSLTAILGAFRERLALLHPGAAGLLEIDADLRLLLCRTAWYQVRRRRHGSLRLAVSTFARAPVFACGFVGLQCADAVLDRAYGYARPYRPWSAKANRR